MDGFNLNTIPKINFLFDFKLPNGYLPFGYTKNNLGINIFNKFKNKEFNEYTIYHSSLQTPNNYVCTFGSPFTTYILEQTKNTEVMGVWDIETVNANEMYLIVIESLPQNNMFEYYNRPDLKIEDLISPKLLDLLKKHSNFKLIFMDMREGSYFHDFNFLIKINNFLVNNSINQIHKVIISTSNNFITKLQYNPKFKDFNNKIKLYSNNYLLLTAGRFIGQLRRLNNNFFENDYNFSLQENVHFNKRDKYFLMYNRNTERVHRPYFVNQLYKNNLLTKGEVSFFENQYLDSFLKNSVEYNPLKLTKDDISDIKENYKKFTPLHIDSDDAENVANYHNFLSRKDEYEKTYFSIVSETNAEEDYSFITEKTIKPIMNLHPFVVVGNPLTLKVLKQYGFKTFDKWWDESYDIEPNFKKRTSLILQVVKELCNKTHDEWYYMLSEMEETLVYNKKLLHKLCYTKQFQKEFFEILLKERNLL